MFRLKIDRTIQNFESNIVKIFIRMEILVENELRSNPNLNYDSLTKKEKEERVKQIDKLMMIQGVGGKAFGQMR